MCLAIVVDTAYVYVSHSLWATAAQIFSSAVLCVMVAGRQALRDDVSVA